MWRFRIEDLGPGIHHFRQYTLERDGRDASVLEVLLAWKGDPAFRSRFNDELAGSPFSAFRWETPSPPRRRAVPSSSC